MKKAIISGQDGANFYTPTYIKGIDGIRAFAVLAVILFHIYPQALPGGFTGVDIFFVISGYVVSSSLAKNYTSNFFQFTIDFYARRIVRLIPILLFFLFVSIVFTTLFIPSSWLSATTNKTALASLFGGSNFIQVWYNDGYFSPRIEFNPFIHTWSLSVEEQFYVIFPSIFFIWYRFKDNTSKYILKNTVKWLLVLLIISSITFAWYETSQNPVQAFYLLPSRFWELGLGALLFKLHLNNKFIFNSSFTHNVYLILGLILITIGFFFANKTSFPFPWAIPSVIGSIFLIIGFVNNTKDKSFLKSIFENNIIVYIGKISYSLYLWHWAIYALFRWTVGLESVIHMFSAVILTFFISSFTYKYIETPFRQNKFIQAQSSRKIVLVGLFSLVISFFAVVLIFAYHNTLTLSTTKDKQLWYPEAYPVIQKKDFISQNDFSKHNLFVLGDSHAGAYSTMLQQLSDEYNVNVYKFSSGGCAVADFIAVPSAKSKSCVSYIQNALAQIETKAKPGDILFLASLRMNRLCDEYALFSQKSVIKNQLSDVAIHNRQLNVEETSALIKNFEKKGLHVIIDAPKPIFKAPPFRCSDWFNKSNPICKHGFSMKRDFLLEFRKPVMESLEILKQKFPKLIIWDPFPVLCKTEICTAFDGNKPLFFDGDHLSAHGNRVLYPSFKNVINSIWEEEKKKI